MITPFKKPDMQMSATSTAAYLSTRASSGGSFAQATRREMDTKPSAETESAEDWTSECMFDCYND
jgi:hypothetical protein